MLVFVPALAPAVKLDEKTLLPGTVVSVPVYQAIFVVLAGDVVFVALIEAELP